MNPAIVMSMFQSSLERSVRARDLVWLAGALLTLTATSPFSLAQGNDTPGTPPTPPTPASTTPSSPMPAPAPTPAVPSMEPTLPGTIAVKPAPAEANQPKLDERTDKLLNDIESADKGLTSLSTTIQYVKRFAEIQGGGTHTWRGTLKYRDAGKGKRQFAVLFDTMIVDDKKRDDKQEYIFDGGWLISRNPVEKQYTRVELVNEAGGKDPLKIGEGPVPLPIGQRKEDMVARFGLGSPADPLDGIDATPEFEGLRTLLKTTRQLRLRPVTGSNEARNYREISLWYRTSDNLPIFARTSNTDDSKGEVLLVDIKTNRDAPFDATTFDTKPPSGWQGEERARR